jgi:cobalt/nickel transport protein
MQPSSRRIRNTSFFLTGLGAALITAVFLSPLASQDPDGLDRVSEDHGFSVKALDPSPAQQLPFHSLFDEYALRGVPEGVATPLAGLVGTLASFGIAWGVGKLLIKPLPEGRGDGGGRLPNPPDSGVD